MRQSRTGTTWPGLLLISAWLPIAPPVTAPRVVAATAPDAVAELVADDAADDRADQRAAARRLRRDDALPPSAHRWRATGTELVTGVAETTLAYSAARAVAGSAEQGEGRGGQGGRLQGKVHFDWILVASWGRFSS